MFTLSDKQRVLNQPSSVKVFSSAGTERTIITDSAIATGDKLLIDGFGHFDVDAITDIKCRRARLAVGEIQDYTVVVPGITPGSPAFAIGDAIEVKIEMDTTRYDSTLFVQDRLGGVKPMIFTTAPLAGILATDIRTAIVAGYNNYVATFPKGLFQVAVAAGTATTSIKTVVASGYEAITVRSVSIRRTNLGIGLQPFSILAKPLPAVAGNVAGFEGEGLGKFLEESIRMATPITTNPYGVDNTETQVDLRGIYTAVYFTVQANYTENLSTAAADHGPLAATHDFVVFLNESTCNTVATPVTGVPDNAITKLAAIAKYRATILTSTLKAEAVAAPLSITNERLQVLIQKTGASVATVATFIA